MTDERGGGDLLTLLTYLLDEMRETSNLLQVADLGRSTRRPWWRNLFFATVRTKSEVTAGFALQYLGENIDRARDHWIEAAARRDELVRIHPGNDAAVLLDRDLADAGFDDVRGGLSHSAIPNPIGEAAVHLGDVVRKIRDCQAVVVRTRTQLLLHKLRESDSG